MPTTVLIVDDDESFCEDLKRVLADAGFSVRVATDGRNAMEILNRDHDIIDVAVIDLNLPEVSGFEVIGAITRRKTAIGILATTGIYKETFLEVAQHLGANIAIRKPEPGEDLSSWVTAIRSILKAEGEMGRASGVLT
jgi:DNA-binding response OmpR family regulator